MLEDESNQHQLYTSEMGEWRDLKLVVGAGPHQQAGHRTARSVPVTRDAVTAQALAGSRIQFASTE